MAYVCVCWVLSFKVLRIEGGMGKRASTGKAKVVDKDDKIRELREDTGSKLVRINATEITAPAITGATNNVMLLSQAVETAGTRIMKAVLAKLGSDSLGRLVETTRNGNFEFKMNRLMKEVFGTDYNNLQELKQKITMCEQCLRGCVDLAFYVSYCGENGELKWVQYSTDLVDASVAAEAAGGAAEAAPELLG